MAVALALLLPVLALVVDQGLTFVLVKWVCASGTLKTFAVLPVMSLLMTGTGAVLGGTVALSLRAANTSGGRPRDSRYLLATMAVALNVLVALLILTAVLPRQLLSPCE
jgi:hypothetical protein